MAVKPVRLVNRGRYVTYQWTLTSADDVAEPTTLLGGRTDVSVKFFGTTDAAGWNTATVIMQGDTEETGTDFVQLRDTARNLLTATNENKIEAILENALRYKPVRSAGALGATGITITLLCAGHS